MATMCVARAIIAELDHALPDDLSTRQKSNHVSYLLQQLRREGRITSEGSTSGSKRMISTDDEQSE